MRQSFPRSLQSGFSLVEIMVGMVIGLIGMVVMMQVFLASDANKRTTSGTGDAQTNGMSAQFALQRDLRMAGYGVTALGISGCNVQLRAGVTLNVIAPVTINHASIPAGDAGSDTLLVVYGNSNGTPEGDVVILQPAVTTYSVATPTSFSPNDWIIAQTQTRASPCNLTMDRVVTRTANLTVGTGLAGMANGLLYNLGQAPRVLAYAVRNGSLTQCDYMAADCSDASRVADAAVWAPIVADILALRAQYGRDTTAAPMDGRVDAWDQITPGSVADVSGYSVQCSIARVQAVRFALVARNGQLEKETVTVNAPTWSGSADAALDVSKNPDGSANADWGRYRYRVFQATVPLRNLVALGAQTTC